jgi:hypothetical protein
MNAKVHDTIGVSPADLVFGKSINLYTRLLLPTPPESLIKGTADISEHRLSNHVAKLTKVQSLLIEIARENQLSADSFHMKEASCAVSKIKRTWKDWILILDILGCEV